MEQTQVYTLTIVTNSPLIDISMQIENEIEKMLKIQSEDASQERGVKLKLDVDCDLQSEE